MSNRKRQPLTPTLRFEVFKRDGFTCIYCGRRPPDVVLHCDHIIAVANDGPNVIDNLVTACADCNHGKGARDLSVAPLTVEQKAELLQERQEQLAAYNAMIFARLEEAEDEAWEVAGVFMRNWGDDHFTKYRFAAIERFLRELPFGDVYEAAEIAMRRFLSGKDRGFRYFCGICWNKIRRLNGEPSEGEE